MPEWKDTFFKARTMGKMKITCRRQMTSPITKIIMSVKTMAYFSGLQIAIKRSKAMATSTEDSRKEKPCTKNI